MVIVYKPTSEYSEKLDTSITKTNLLTGIMIQGVKKIFSGDIGGATTTEVYTVPVGKTLFIVSGLTSAYSAGGGIGVVGIRQDSSTGALILGTQVNTIKIMSDMPQTFTIPIVIPTATKLYACSSHAAAGGTYSFIAYEVDNFLLPTFI